jgi:TnpA family transposase
MPKVTARLTVKGVDLKEMMNQAIGQMADLTDAQWTISEIELWGQEDVASREGMARLWSASMSLEANVS